VADRRFDVTNEARTMVNPLQRLGSMSMNQICLAASVTAMMAQFEPSFWMPFVAVGLLIYGAIYMLPNKQKPVAVSQVCVYPVKSCAEWSVDEAVCTRIGFEGDRCFQVSAWDGSRLKYCTPREHAHVRLFHVKAELGETTLVLDHPNMKRLTVDLSAPRKLSPEVEVFCEPRKMALHDLGDEVATWLPMFTLLYFTLTPFPAPSRTPDGRPARAAVRPTARAPNTMRT
jgi:hypothetical protein